MALLDMGLKERPVEYVEFMTNSKNVWNCRECPENKLTEDIEEERHPCGQYHCWVAVHCRLR